MIDPSAMLDEISILQGRLASANQRRDSLEEGVKTFLAMPRNRKGDDEWFHEGIDNLYSLVYGEGDEVEVLMAQCRTQEET